MPDQRADEDDKRPASRRVADELKALINVGTYPVNTALPPLREIATQYGIAVNTAMAAARLLSDEGYVTSKPNGGYFVRDRTGEVDPAQELRTVRAELVDLRTQVRETRGTLAAVEDRISALSDLVGRLEDQSRGSGQRPG